LEKPVKSNASAADMASMLIPRSAYIVSPSYDWVLFLLPPVMALLLGYLIKDTWVANNIIEFAGYEQTLAGLLM
jgi:hypothetical protein